MIQMSIAGMNVLKTYETFWSFLDALFYDMRVSPSPGVTEGVGYDKQRLGVPILSPGIAMGVSAGFKRSSIYK